MKFRNLLLLSLFLPLATLGNDNPWTQGFVKGNVELKSISKIEFGPGGILFIGDPMAASLFAIETKDDKKVEFANREEIENIDEKLAALLGTGVSNITINDLAANQSSGNIYFAVTRSDASGIQQAVIVRYNGDFEVISLDNVNHSRINLSNPVSMDAEQRGNKLRPLAVTDIKYDDGKIYVSGLSNEEFSSTFRTIPFPFSGEQTYSSLEIYHVSHGRYETYAPIRTFIPFELNGKPHLIAGFTCTPLVTIPLESNQDGKNVKGKTVAELGNRNAPTDILSYTKDGKEYLLVSNSNRTLMKIDPEDIENQSGLNQPLEKRFGTAGIEFAGIAEVYVNHMDNLNENNLVWIQRMGDGNLKLRTMPISRL